MNDNQIPTQVTGACTSTQSVISHVDTENGYAVVHYYDKDYFLNTIIKKRYERLNWDTASLLSIDGFKNDFPKHERPVDSIEIGIYDDLKLYYDNIEICREIFDKFKTQVRVDNLDEVKKFVTYSKESGVVQSRVANLVVKKVEIFCKFPVEDIGQISVVDTPGMNTATEDRDREILCDVLNNSADFVLLFGAPGTLGLSAVETRLCSDFRQCMPLIAGDELKKRAFFLANQGKFVDEKGGVYRDSTNEEFNKLHYEAYKKGFIPAEKYIRLNAKDPQQVQQKVLEELLEYLSVQFPSLDALQINSAKEILEAIGKEVEALLADIVAELGFLRTTDPENYRVFRSQFEALLPRLSSSLARTLDEMMPARDIDINAHLENDVPQGNVLTEALKQIVRKYRDNTPDFLALDSVKQEIYANPGQGGAAFFNLMSNLRCYIIGLFATMDGNCWQIVEDAKTKLENVFRDSAAGGMGNINELKDKHGSEFFATLSRFAQTVKAPLLAKQLDTYANFKLSFSGFMAHKVSAHLDPVRASGYRKTLPEPVDFSNPEEIQTALLELGKKAVNDIAVEFSGALLSEPCEAVFAMSENFVDTTLRTVSVKEDWSNLYEALKGDVWPELFDPNHSANRSMLQLRENLSGLKSLLEVLKELVA